MIPKISNPILASVLIAALGFLFFWGTSQQLSLVNTDMTATDQSSYMNYAKELKTSDYQYIGDRNRMPAYPYIMSYFYNYDMTDKAFFEKGKQVGVFISVLIIAIIFSIFRKFSRIKYALTATLVAAFTAIAYKAPYFQTEVLFYGLGLILFILCLSVVRHPKVSIALLIGGLAGLIHLTKASVLPLLAITVFCLILRALFEIRNASKKNTTGSMIRNALCILSIAGAFLTVISPYLINSKEKYGNYFYNVNSTFYMWYDSWEEAKTGTRAHDDRSGWPDMADKDIPSLGKYFEEHSLSDIFQRQVKGYVYITGISLFFSYGYGPFALVYITIASFFFWQNRKADQVKRLFRNNATSIIFVGLFFTCYFNLYAWYCPIACGNRFNLSLFLPVLLLCLRSFSFFEKHELQAEIRNSKFNIATANKAITALLALYIVGIYPWLISTMYSGE